MAPIRGGRERRREGSAPATTERPRAGGTRSVAGQLAGLLDREPALLPHGSTVLVAVSGGGDSMALLHLLVEAAPSRALDLRAAHFDHGVRDGSAAEAETVRGWCARLGVPCVVGRADDPGSDQAAYRAARYAFLRRERRRAGAARVALAHQRDDHIETLLHRLARGTGIRGLGGIPVRRGPFVRPLLAFGRVELRAELERRGVPWLRDPSNEDPGYARSRIRHDLIPRLVSVAGEGVAERWLRLSLDAGHADRGLEARAAAGLARIGAFESPEGRGVQIARSGLAMYDRAEQARMLRILARNQGFELSRGGTRSGVEFIRRGVSGGGVDLAAGLRLTREYDRLRLGSPGGERPDRELEIVAAGSGRGTAELGGRTYEVRWNVGRHADPGTSGSRWSVDLAAGALVFPLRLRGPRPGDRIRTRAGTRKLKKVWSERRVPRSRREQVPVLATADGTVVWVVGHAVAEHEAALRDRERFRIGVGEH